MRPLRLSVEGFSAFRDRTDVDFDGVDLFAFVGATGAGKSSLIDAIVFALYGSVPRYADAKLVAPVITQGAVEARVRLDFELGGETYSATRVVRRTKTGATTAEARLEHGPTVLADDARGMTTAVVDLIGLDLGQFTKCVVLPQGEFATLLHDGKADRQKLLVKLLDLGLYNQIAALARSRAKDASYKIEAIADQLAAAVGIGERIDAAAARRDRLDGVIGRIDAAASELAAAAEEIAAADRDLAEHAALRRALGEVRAPAGLGDLATGRDRAAADLAVADDAEQRAAARVAEAAAARDGLGDAAALRAQRQRWEALDTLEGRVATGTIAVADQEAAIEPLAAALAEANERVRSAADDLDAARIAHAAAAVVAQIDIGDDCPVCGATVTEFRHHDDTALVAATDAHSAAMAAERTAREAHDAAAFKLAGNREFLAKLTADRDEARAGLVDAPPVAELDGLLAGIAEADRDLAAARDDETAARSAVRAARTALDRADAALAEARRAYTAARDAVAASGPPSPTDDLGADWTALVEWAADADAHAAAAAKTATERRQTADERRRSLLDELAADAIDAGVSVSDPGRVRDACVTAREQAAAEHGQLAAQRDQLEEVAARRDALVESRDVHDVLARELGARNFEAWLLDEALDVLLAGASDWLDTLSSGRYALAVDDKHAFVVIDHANAAERRLARTLSGGETFLASLALALALAEGVGDLSASGGRRLDAIFLDEGFGTLDADTLDVVATAIEELGATGRMVGIVSHVPELAERVPVRFEVTKGAVSSSVERVER